MATTSEIWKLLNQNIRFTERGLDQGQEVSATERDKYVENSIAIAKMREMLLEKVESGTITDEERSLLERIAEVPSAWKPGADPWRSEPEQDPKREEGERVDPIVRHAREQFHKTKDRYGDAMRLARKGVAKKGDGLSTEEHKEYRDAVAYLKKRMNLLHAKRALGRTSIEEDALLDLMVANQNLWAYHNGKPIKVDGKMIGEAANDDGKGHDATPRHYEARPLDIPFVSEAVDEMAQAFGHGTYGDENDRLSRIIAEWAKRRASEVTDKAKSEAIGYAKEYWANRGRQDGLGNNPTEQGEPVEDDAGLTAFLYQYATMQQRADDGDAEAMAWVDGEGSGLLDYWFDRVCEPDDEEWYVKPHHTDDLKASFEEVDDDGIDIQSWLDQQVYDPLEAYLSEHPFIAFARNLWLRTRPALDRVRDVSSGLWNTIKRVIVKPAIEVSKMSDEEWRRRTDSIKERQQIWVASYTKSDGTRVKGHNKTITKNAR